MNYAHVMGTRQDEAGWYWFDCSCGIHAGPFPGQDEADDEASWHEETLTS